LRSRAGGHAQRHHGKQKKNTTAAAPHRKLGSAAQKIERVNLAGPPIGWVHSAMVASRAFRSCPSSSSVRIGVVASNEPPHHRILHRLHRRHFSTPDSAQNRPAN
jgi:hypothetical protein